MSVKDAIVDGLREDGFDFLTACEEADRVIKEFVASGKTEARFHTKSGWSILLKNNKPKPKGK